MRQILVKSAFALALGIAPGIAFGQAEMPKKKPAAEQPEGQGAGQNENGSVEKGTRSETPGRKAEETAPRKSGTPGAEEGGGEQGEQPKAHGAEKGGGEQGEQPKAHGAEKGGEEGAGKKHNEQGTPEGQEAPGAKKHVGEEGSKEKHGKSVHVTDEQRTELRKAFRENHVEPVPRIDFPLNVGVAIPRTVHLHHVPRAIVRVVPEYEGYEYFMLADGRIVIVDPETLEIVFVMG